MKLKPLYIHLFLLCLVLFPAYGQAATPIEHILDNGLKVIVKEDHRAPVVVFQIWYKVGSSYEPPGKTGMSHILEHMMFKGTDNIPAGELSNIVSRYGGKENAFTNKDYTGYYQMFEASRLPISFELEADRMLNLNLDEDEFQKELQVVIEERRMRTEDRPAAKAYEHFIATAFVSSPYQQPVIGWMHDLNSMTLANLQNWYDTWYAPNNATIVVVGDVQADEVIALAQTYFGSIPAKSLPDISLPREIDSLGTRRVNLEMQVHVASLYMGYNVPGLHTAAEPGDAYALEVLAGVLDGGYSARIESRLVRRDKVASSAGAGYSPFTRGDTIFMLSAVPAADKTLLDLEEAFLAEIEDLKNSPPSEDELGIIQAQMISSLIYQKDSLISQANQIGQLESSGFSWEMIETHQNKIKQVTPEQVSAAARKYLITKNLTVTTLMPATQSTDGSSIEISETLVREDK